MATSAASATKEWQKNQENEQLKKKVNLIAAQTANQQKNAQLNQGNPSALPSTTAVNVNGQQSLPSIPTSKPADPKAEMAKATAKAINTNPANNLEEPVNAATEKSANDAKIEGEEDNPIIPRPSQNDDVTKAQLGVNANEAAKGEKPTNVVNAPVGDDVFDSFSYEDRPSIKGRWNWNLEHSFMLPKSAWADEVRKNAQVENQMRAQDSAQWQMRRNQQNDLLSKKMAAQKAEKPQQLNNAAAKIIQQPLTQMDKLNKLYENHKISDEDYDYKFDGIVEGYVNRCNTYGVTPDTSMMLRLTGEKDNIQQSQREDAQLKDNATAVLNNANAENLGQALQQMEENNAKIAAKSANRLQGSMTGRKGGLASFAGDKEKMKVDFQKQAGLVEDATTIANSITEWASDPKTWQQKTYILDPLGDYLGTRLAGENGSSMADAAKVRVQFQAMSPQEKKLVLGEMKAFQDYCYKVMQQNGKIVGHEQAVQAAGMGRDATQKMIDGIGNGDNPDGTKIGEGIAEMTNMLKTYGSLLTGASQQGDMMSRSPEGGLAAAVEAHKNYWDGIMKAGSQNPRFLYDLCDQIYTQNKKKIDQRLLNTGSNPYYYRPYSHASDEQIDALMADWPIADLIANVPDYGGFESMKHNPAVTLDKKGKKQNGKREKGNK